MRRCRRLRRRIISPRLLSSFRRGTISKSAGSLLWPRWISPGIRLLRRPTSFSISLNRSEPLCGSTPATPGRSRLHAPARSCEWISRRVRRSPSADWVMWRLRSARHRLRYFLDFGSMRPFHGGDNHALTAECSSAIGAQPPKPQPLDSVPGACR